MFILDCDIASTFAKIDRVGLLNKTFSSNVHITNSVHIELMRAKEMGFGKRLLL